jgi:hypothetical protein
LSVEDKKIERKTISPRQIPLDDFVFTSFEGNKYDALISLVPLIF